MKLSHSLVALAAAGAAAVTAGCGSSAPAAADGGADQPDSPVGTVVDPGDSPAAPGPMRPRVIWDGSILHVLAYGSSSCPPVASQASVAGEHRIRITFAAPPAGQPCTDDYGGPHRSRVDAPSSGIDLDRPVTGRLVLDGDDPIVRVLIRHP